MKLQCPLRDVFRVEDTGVTFGLLLIVNSSLSCDKCWLSQRKVQSSPFLPEKHLIVQYSVTEECYIFYPQLMVTKD